MENAILMASGMGTRLRPLTENTPKPLLKVNGKPMIETIIDGLNRRKIDNIIIVTGYLKEQFQYLQEKYSNIILLNNDVFEKVNNISSVYAAREWLDKGNCFICEADLYVADASMFDCEYDSSCYFGKFISGFSDDWVFDTDETGKITRVGKCGTDCFNMVGISYFNEKEAHILREKIEVEYGKEGFESLFWDDVVNRHIESFELKINEVGAKQIFEIDTIEDLEKVARIVKKG